MKVYIVTSGVYSQYGIEAVFTNLEQAERFCAVHNDSGRIFSNLFFAGFRIEEYDTDPELSLSDTKQAVYRYEFYADKWGVRDFLEEPILFSVNETLHTPYVKLILKDGLLSGGEYKVFVLLKENNKDKALKIAQDCFGEYMAQKEDI